MVSPSVFVVACVADTSSSTSAGEQKQEEVQAPLPPEQGCLPLEEAAMGPGLCCCHRTQFINHSETEIIVISLWHTCIFHAWKVVEDCDEVLQAQPHSLKAIFRRGKALLALGRYLEAQSDIEKAKEVHTLPCRTSLIHYMRHMCNDHYFTLDASMCARLLRWPLIVKRYWN